MGRFGLTKCLWEPDENYKIKKFKTFLKKNSIDIVKYYISIDI